MLKPQNPIQILHAPVGLYESDGLAQLESELRGLRPGQAMSYDSQWMHFLMHFYRHPLTGKYEPIKQQFLGGETLLQTRVDEVGDDHVKRLIEELAYLNRKELSEHHAHERMFLALNNLVRPRFKHLHAKPRLKRAAPRR